jgi:hypothetical protein
MFMSMRDFASLVLMDNFQDMMDMEMDMDIEMDKDTGQRN